MSVASLRVGAVVLAAGLSRRMGRPKPLLPWRPGETVIEAVVAALTDCTYPVVVVCGQWYEAIAPLVAPLGAQALFNSDYETGEMLSSFKVGLAALPADLDAALIVLGDQPRLTAEVVERLAAALVQSPHPVAAPSFGGRRGHPIAIRNQIWPEFLSLPAHETPRAVIQRHAHEIEYLDWGDDAVLCDIDTPEAYALERAKAGLQPVDLTAY